MWTVVVNIFVWLFFHLSISYAAFRVPLEYFQQGSALYTERSWEQGGRFYEKVFRIKSWKGLLPDGGDVFTGGFAKKHLAAKDSAYLQVFVAESRRAELTHYGVMLPAPLFFVWNEPWVGGIMLLYAAAVNLPCILAQRYNRIRLNRVLNRMKRPVENLNLKNYKQL